MSTQPTNNSVPSESPRDLKFNAGKIDEFVTSLALRYIDRLGQGHYTIEGLRDLAQQAIAGFGWVPLGSFQAGATLTLPNQILKDTTDGEYYRWDGSFPKSVSAGSTPANSGGVGKGHWIAVGDSALRTMLKSTGGAAEVGTASGNSVQQELTENRADLNSIFQKSSSSVDIIIGYGQSNKVGYARSSDGWPSSITPKAKYYNSLTGSLEPVIPAMHNTSGQDSTGNSWGVFSNRFVSLTGREIVILPSAIGGMSIAQLSKGTSYYTSMLAGFNAIKNIITSQNKSMGRVYATFNQGEQDMKIGTSKLDYKNAVVQLINDMKADFNLAGFFMEICGSPRSGYGTEANMYRIQLSQREICNEVYAVYLGADVQTSFTVANGLMQSSDGVHYSQAGYNMLGNQLAENVADVAKGNEFVTAKDSVENYGMVVHSPRRNWLYTFARIIFSGGAFTLLDESQADKSFSAPNIDGVSLSGGSLLIGMATNAPKVGGECIFSNHYKLLQNGINIQGSYASLPGVGRYAISLDFFADLEFIVDSAGNTYSVNSTGSGNTLIANEFLSKNITKSVSGSDVTLNIPAMYGAPSITAVGGSATLKSMTLNSIVITFGSGVQYVVVKISRCKILPNNLPVDSEFSVSYVVANSGD